MSDARLQNHSVKDPLRPFSKWERIGLVSTLRRYNHLQMQVLKIAGLKFEDGENRATIRDSGLLKGSPESYEFAGFSEDGNVVSKLSRGGFDFRFEVLWSCSLQSVRANPIGYPTHVDLYTQETGIDLRDKPSRGWAALREARANLRDGFGSYRAVALAGARSFRGRIQQGNADHLGDHAHLV